jgi:hypothetical protein
MKRSSVFLISLISLLIGCGQETIDSGTYITNGKGYCACETRKELEQFIEFSIEKDYQAMSEYLASNKCIKVAGGIKVFVETGSISGIVQIRPEGDSGKVWTVIEALRTE